ncbi:sodium:proton antiporter [Mobilicoccus massiliensis]|uniref:sodium:proton antiporter n=1 Tax=Mobilicoccus massiliensis TaxID=1522310 RepID=UPI00059139F7|nr:cation:proton antiporter subunit C [Mobilicoccus massiliensis]
MILAATIAVLVTGGVYLLLSRSMVRVVFGMTLFSHAANLMLLATGVSAWRGEPLTDRMDSATVADPLPMAFVLTAIVISMAVTVFMLMLAVLGHNDDTYRMPATGENEDR